MSLFEFGKNNGESLGKRVTISRIIRRMVAEVVNFNEFDLWQDEESDGKYILPVPNFDNSLEIGKLLADRHPPELVTEQIGQHIVSRSPESHTEAYSQALDFLVPDGTPVLAAERGKIIQIVMHNEEWGLEPGYADKLNYVTLLHENGELTQYCHLAYESLSEEIRDKIHRNEEPHVEKGQFLALTGKTGWTDRDHLHFLVFRLETHQIIGDKKVQNPHGFKSLKPRFDIT